MGNLVKYGAFTLEAAEEEKQELARSGGAADFMKLGVGRNVVRFLPPPLGKRSPFRVIFQHYINVPGATAPVSFTCPRMEVKKPCPACQKADELRSSGNPADSDRAWDLMPKRRVFANVINRGEPERGPLVMAFGKQVHEQLIALREDEDAGGNYCDPTDKGFDIIIAREGTGKNDTKYTVHPARKLSPLGNMEWIELQKNLDQYARVPTLDEMLKMLRGEVSDRSSGGGNGGGGGARAASSGGGGAGKGRSRRSAEDDVIDTEAETTDE